MKKISLFLFVFITTMLSSCEIVGGIFKAGVWVGVLIVVAVIALIIWLVSRGRK
ncbi:MAG TPA: phosphatidate cytidylyltransferase [Chitinophagaceae bacterium]|jgi:hypothetical protein